MRQSHEQTIAASAVSTGLLPPNPRRRSIVVSSDSHPVYISEYNPAVSGFGVQVRQDNMPTILCCRDVGNWLLKALFVVAPAGATNVTVIEVEADPFGDVQDYPQE